MEKYANLQGIWHTFLIVGIKVVHTEFIWLSLITEQNLIILDTGSDFSGDAYCRKEYLTCVTVCQFKCVILNNSYSWEPSFLGNVAIRNYTQRSTAIRHYLFKVNKVKKRTPSFLTGDKPTISLCGVGGKTRNFCLSIFELLFPKQGLQSTCKDVSPA